MSVADQIRRIKNAKAAIKQAIQSKGVAVSDTAKLDEYPALIDRISTDGGDSSLYPNFFEIRTNHNTDYSYLFYYNKLTDNIVFPDIDTSKVTDMQYMFHSCYAKSIDISNLDTSSVTDMKYMFYNLMYVTSLDISHFVTDNVTSMEYMFSKDNMISLDLSSFNANKVTTMKNMFYLCSQLQSIIGLDTINANSLTGNGINSIFQTCKKITSLDLSGLNVSNITELQNICDGCSALEYINITGWNTSNVTTLYKAFTDCEALVTIDGVLDLSGVKNGLYPASSTHPFAKCSSLETLYLKNIYKDVSITNASKFSIDLGATKVKDECLVYIINELPNLADKGITNNTAIKLTLPKTNTLTEEQKQVARDKGWIVVN